MEFFSLHEIDNMPNVQDLVNQFILRGGDTTAPGNGLDQLQMSLMKNYDGAVLNAHPERMFEYGKGVSYGSTGNKRMQKPMGVYAARRSSAEHLIATKALRCHSYGWFLILAQCSVIL